MVCKEHQSRETLSSPGLFFLSVVASDPPGVVVVVVVVFKFICLFGGRQTDRERGTGRGREEERESHASSMLNADLVSRLSLVTVRS